MSSGQSTSLNRGDLYDRNGHLLATNVKTKSICCNPLLVAKKWDNKIQQLFGVNLDPYRKSGKQFLWLKRHISDADEIKDINGVYLKPDQIRYYPFWALTNSLVGFCDQNSNGQHGLEYSMDSILRKVDVVLSLDISIQLLLHHILTKALNAFEAEGASGVIIDMVKGRIRAIVSIPSPSIRKDFLEHRFRNRNLDPVEVGSVMKLLNVAIAIEHGYPTDWILDATGPLQLGKFEINDFLGVNREITLGESLWRSSNIANARLALEMGKKIQRYYLKKIGLLSKLEWSSNWRATPITPKKYGKVVTATIGYGHGIAITTFHLAQILFAVTTGYTFETSLLENPTSWKKKRIFADSTVKQMRQLMYEVVEKSNRKTLLINGCKIGAKTGTANLIINGQYTPGRNFVTLVTVFPIDKPELMIILQMNDPKSVGLRGGAKYTTAANVLGRYMRSLIIKLNKKHLI